MAHVRHRRLVEPGQPHRLHQIIRLARAHALPVGFLNYRQLGHLCTRHLAHHANALGPFEAVIHNAGVYAGPPETIWTVNFIAPDVWLAVSHDHRAKVSGRYFYHLAESHGRSPNLGQPAEKAGYCH